MVERHRSLIRDLINQLEHVAMNHMAYSQVIRPFQNAMDHMSAIARIEEYNQNGKEDRPG